MHEARRALSGCGEDRIECRLQVVDLDASPQYIAISYTWGQAGDETEILVDGHCILIRRNLYDCLHTPRDRVSNLYLWIDVLSISQSDLDEKSPQVAMIGRIFAQAVEVRTWFGHHADESQSLFSDEQILTRLRQDLLPTIKLWLRKTFRPYILANLLLVVGLWFLAYLLQGSIVSNYFKLLPLILLSIPLTALGVDVLRQQLLAAATRPGTHEFASRLRPLRALLRRFY